MKLRFSDAQWDGGRGLPPPNDVVLGVEATLRLVADDGRVMYEEVLFPVVELALAIEDWLAAGITANDDFSFRSVEAEESDLLWCRTQNNGWQIGAHYQSFADLTIRDTGQIVSMFSEFVQDVDGWLKSALGRSLQDCRESTCGSFIGLRAFVEVSDPVELEGRRWVGVVVDERDREVLVELAEMMPIGDGNYRRVIFSGQYSPLLRIIGIAQRVWGVGVAKPCILRAPDRGTNDCSGGLVVAASLTLYKPDRL